MSLGLITTPVPIKLPTFNAGGVQAAVPPSTGSGSIWNSIVDIGTKVTNVVKTGAAVAQQTKSTLDVLKAKTQAVQQGTSPAPAVPTNTNQGGTNPAPTPDEGMSMTAKVLIGVGVASAIAGGIYLVVYSGKKGKGLGCPCEEEKTVDTSVEVVSSELNGPKKRKRK